MANPFLLIFKQIKGNDISGIAISYFPKWPIFPFLGFLVSRHRICDLDIGIIAILLSYDKIAFEIADFPYAYLVSVANQIKINNVFQ